MNGTNGGTVNLNAGSRLENYANFTNSIDFVNSGTITNSGTLTNSGTVFTEGILDNHYVLINSKNCALNNSGTLNNHFTFDNFGILINSGTLNNHERLNNESSLDNLGTLNNDKSLYNYGTLTNSGTITNSGTLNNNAGGTIKLHRDFALNGTNGGTVNLNAGGSLENYATLTNVAGHTQTNAGIILNSRIFNNNGILTNLSGATFINDGTFTTTTTFTNNGLFAGIGTTVGNVINNGTVAPGSNIAMGTMTINGDYTHNSGATYKVKVNSSGQSDKLVVSGAANIRGGTVLVAANTGSYQERTDYTILTAGSISGTFTDVRTDLTFLSPSLIYGPKRIDLRLTRNGTSFGDIAPQQPVAAVFDKISPAGLNTPPVATTPSDMKNVLNILLDSSATVVRDDLDQMGGFINTATPYATFSVFHQYINTVTTRMSGFLTADSSALVAEPLMFASNNASTGRMGEGALPSGVWALGYGSIAERRADDVFSRYDFKTQGVASGFDRKINPSLLIGASLGYAHTSVDMVDLEEKGTISSYQGSIYGIYKHDPWYVRTAAAYSFNQYETERDITSMARSANANYNGHTLGAFLEGGLKVATKYVDVIPSVSVMGSRLWRESFSESNADALNLYVDRDRASSLIGSLGIRLLKDYKLTSGTLTPELRIRWDHQFSDDSYTMDASFAGYPTSSFRACSEKISRDSLAVGLGLTRQVNDEIYITMKYDATLFRDTTAHAGMLGLKYLW